MATLIGAIDQGTTSTRFILYRIQEGGDGGGDVARLTPVASHQMEHTQIYPRAGWCEHDPEEIMANTLTCIDRALAAVPGGGATASDVRCVGITNQRETTVAWDRGSGKPLHNAVVWMDMRTAQLCDDLAAQFGGDKDHFRATCGLPISTYFSAMKMKWLLDNSPEVAAGGGGCALGPWTAGSSTA